MISRGSSAKAKADATTAAMIAEQQAAARFRASNPAEQARTALQRLGLSVVRAAVFDAGAAGWVVAGNHRAPLDDDQIIALAARRTASAERVAALRRPEMYGDGTTEAERLAARGLTRARVLDDIEDCRKAAGSLPRVAELAGLHVQVLSNARGGKPVSATTLAALYGETGGELRGCIAAVLFEDDGEAAPRAPEPQPEPEPEPVPESPPTPDPMPLARAVAEAAAEPVAETERFVVPAARPAAQEIVITPVRDLGALVRPVCDELDKARAQLATRGAAIDAEIARLSAERDAVVGRLAKFEAAASVLLELAA